MIWQDYAIAAIQVAFFFSLIPAIAGPAKPARTTCAMTGGLLYALAAVLATLGLWFGAWTSVLCGAGWTVLLVQKRA